MENLQVGTNGYFTFDEYYGYIPFNFGEDMHYSLVAPFFADFDIRGENNSNVSYEVHRKDISEDILSTVNSFITDREGTVFNGEWLLVATWTEVSPYMRNGMVRLVLYLHSWGFFVEIFSRITSSCKFQEIFHNLVHVRTLLCNTPLSALAGIRLRLSEDA